MSKNRHSAALWAGLATLVFVSPAVLAAEPGAELRSKCFTFSVASGLEQQSLPQPMRKSLAALGQEIDRVVAANLGGDRSMAQIAMNEFQTSLRKRVKREAALGSEDPVVREEVAQARELLRSLVENEALHRIETIERLSLLTERARVLDEALEDRLKGVSASSARYPSLARESEPEFVARLDALASEMFKAYGIRAEQRTASDGKYWAILPVNPVGTPLVHPLNRLAWGLSERVRTANPAGVPREGVVLSFQPKANLQQKFLGAYRDSEKRILMSFKMLAELEMDSTGGHEVVHAAQFARASRGEPSPFVGELKASPGAEDFVEGSAYGQFLDFSELSAFSYSISHAAARLKTHPDRLLGGSEDFSVAVERLSMSQRALDRIAEGIASAARRGLELVAEERASPSTMLRIFVQPEYSSPNALSYTLRLPARLGTHSYERTLRVPSSWRAVAHEYRDTQLEALNGRGGVESAPRRAQRLALLDLIEHDLRRQLALAEEFGRMATRVDGALQYWKRNPDDAEAFFTFYRAALEPWEHARKSLREARKSRFDPLPPQRPPGARDEASQERVRGGGPDAFEGGLLGAWKAFWARLTGQSRR